MALDEALSDSVRQGQAPVLRFYSWDPSTLSLGRFQHPGDGLSREAALVPRVRRVTGGGAIWHDDELTYSLACGQDDLGTTGVKASFERICGFLLDAWRSFGWEACYAKDAPGASDLGRFSPACFAGQEEYDILVNGKKLGGNAQRRDRNHIFQHGSIPLGLDRRALDRLFAPGFSPPMDRTTDLNACGWGRRRSDLVPILSKAFEARMGVELREDEPNDGEVSRARDLVQGRYATEEWTENGSGSVRAAGGPGPV